MIVLSGGKKVIQVFQDKVRRGGNEPAAPVRGNSFYIQHDPVRAGQDPGIRLKIERAVGIQQAGFALFPDQRKQLQQEISVQRAFASGDCDALNIGKGPGDLSENLLHGHPADPGRSVMRAGFNTGVTAYTGIPVPGDLAVSADGKGAGGTAGYTQAAGRTQSDCFRVMAEKAVETAALEENGGPVSRTVHI